MAVHRYWRIRFGGTGGEGSLRVVELKFRTFKGGVSLTGAPFSNGSHSTFTPDKAFDGLTDTFWIGTNSVPSIGLDLGTPAEVFEYQITPAGVVETHPNFTLEASDTNDVWEVVDTRSVIWEASVAQTFTLAGALPPPGLHTYWRLTGFLTDSTTLELSQAQLYDGTTLIAQAPTFSIPPASGVAFPETLRWDDFSMPGFALTWNLANPVKDPLLRLGAGSSADNFPKEFYCQYSDDGKFWSTNNAPVNVAFPGAGLMTAVPGTATEPNDPDFAKVVLLLNEGMVDTSSTPKTVTAFNGAVDGLPAKFGNKALQFLKGSSMEVGVASDFAFGTEDFTLEGWVLPTAYPDGFGALIDFRLPQGNGRFPLVYLEAGMQMTYFVDSVAAITTANTAPLNEWTHWALCRASGQTRLFLSGVPASTVFADAGAYPGQRACLGKSGENPIYGHFTGSLDEVRITRGLARYTAAFTPPTTAFPNAVQSVAPSDPDFSKVSLLLGDSLTDKSNAALALTLFGGVAISTGTSKWGKDCLTFDGTGDYVKTPTVPAFGFGTGDFTIEGIFLFNEVTANCTFLTPDIVGSWFLFEKVRNRINIYGLAMPDSIIPVLQGAWTHIALCRSAGQFYLYIDGGLASGPTANTFDFGSSRSIFIGGNPDAGALMLNGKAHDVRITKGLARYTADFTPPTVEFPSASQSVVARPVTTFAAVVDHGYTSAANAYTKWATELAVSSTATLSNFNGDDAFFTLDLGFPTHTGGAENRLTYSTESGFLLYKDVPANFTSDTVAGVLTKDSASVGRMGFNLVKPAFFLCVRQITHDGGTFNGKWQKTASTAIFFYRIAHYTGAAEDGAMDVAVRFSTGSVQVVATPVNTLVPRIQTFEYTSGVLSKGTVVAQDFAGTVVYASGGAVQSVAVDPSGFIPLSGTPQAKRWRRPEKNQQHMAGSDQPEFNLREVTMETSFMDAYNGGLGRIYGTVAEKGSPNKFLAREVLLIDENSNMVIHKTWSDPLTGAYAFLGIKEGVRYSVLSYDYTNDFRAVIADNQVPERIA